MDRGVGSPEQNKALRCKSGKVIGRRGPHFFGKSADSCSRETVKERFAELQQYGAIPWALVVQELRDDVILGRVAIREFYMNEWDHQEGRAITKPWANANLQKRNFPLWRGTRYAKETHLIEVVRKDRAARSSLATSGWHSEPSAMKA